MDEKNKGGLLIKDRRENPSIRTGKRVNFDRRYSIRLLDSYSVTIDANDKIKGTMLNISDTGLCILLKAPLSLNNKIFNLNISPYYEKSLKGEIAWTDVNPDESKFVYGIKFVDLIPEDKKNLKELVFLNREFLIEHAKRVAGKLVDPKKRNEVFDFFLIDVKQTIADFVELENDVNNNGYPAEGYIKFKAILDRLLLAGDKLEKIIGVNILAKEIKYRVRSLIGYFIYQGNIMRRGLEKPRGYPGDYQMLEYVYDNIENSQGIGKYFDRYFLDDRYSVAVRGRKDKMRKILLNFIDKFQGEEVNILNLGCGSFRELREMFDSEISCKGKVNIVGIDHDQEAIDFAYDKLGAIDISNFNLKMINGNILKLDKIELGFTDKVDLIYSTGIADYLQDRMLGKILRECLGLLKMGGKLVVAYKDKDCYRPLPANWCCDWYFVPRNEKEFIELIEKCSGRNRIRIDLERENSGIVFFTTITKVSE